MVVSPYGFWSSPITSDLVVADAIRLDQVALDGNAIYWTESQPQKQGRYFVYRVIEGKEPELVTPDDENHFNVRTRVHEYGGGSFVVEDGIVYFSNFVDQRLYRQNVGQQLRPITPPRTDALRYADGVIDRRRGRIICVQEDHTLPGKVINTLVSIDITGGTGAAHSCVRERLLFDTPPESGWQPFGLADLESPQYAMAHDRGLGW